MKWNAILTGFAVLIQRPALRCRFVTGSTGSTRLEAVELSAVRGYADSWPARFGNRAAKQRQLGSLAFFADCARIYIESGGSLRDKHWQLLPRTAHYTCALLGEWESISRRFGWARITQTKPKPLKCRRKLRTCRQVIAAKPDPLWRG
jgi:hypothetical protein